MAYNKAREEKKWLLWKEAEEKELRRLGVAEEIIQEIRVADWETFKAERRYYEHLVDADINVDQQAANEDIVNVPSVQDLLDDIENEELHRVLLSVDKLTLRIVILKMQGYSQREIAKRLNLTDKAVYRRIDRLKEKMKKFL